MPVLGFGRAERCLGLGGSCGFRIQFKASVSVFREHDELTANLTEVWITVADRAVVSRPQDWNA